MTAQCLKLVVIAQVCQPLINFHFSAKNYENFYQETSKCKQLRWKLYKLYLLYYKKLGYRPSITIYSSTLDLYRSISNPHLPFFTQAYPVRVGEASCPWAVVAAALQLQRGQRLPYPRPEGGTTTGELLRGFKRASIFFWERPNNRWGVRGVRRASTTSQREAPQQVRYWRC